ncbi:MAG TPA: hypothetical protein VJ981_07945 [Gammaproteobacteria bacterium]|nr:hypothetical protein [Gammaproteobacteria bacterium]
MKLSVKAFAISAAIIWGLAMLLTTTLNLLYPGYGAGFLAAMSSVYPGFTPSLGVKSIITGTLYGVVDAGIAGAVFAWLYNCFVKST